MAKSFVEEFDVKEEETNLRDIPDYEAFTNKKLLDELRNKIIQNLIDNNTNNQISMSSFVRKEIDKTLEGYDLSVIERSYINNLIDNEINGYGPITELLDDPSITEIMVNGTNEIYIELDGRLIKDDSVSFINNEHIIRTIQRLIQPIGRTIDTSNPMVDARLSDGSRLNAIIEPLSLNGPVLTIRKFKKELASIEDFLRNGTMTPYMARFIEACVKSKMNIIVCGGTGSGKTTLLNVMSSFIGDDERIITIEDAAELKLEQDHVISLETRGTNYEGSGEVTIRDLVINSLRMRPDRIIVGEVRGKEAFDMMQAMNTGHEGSMTTLHANSPKDALNRLETMMLMAGMEIPIKAIREYMENAIDIVIHISRLTDGKRKITSICEVVGFEKDEIKLNEIFAFNQTGLTEEGEVNGEFVLNKATLKTYDRLKSRGITNLKDIFE
ncbi:MAG: CpaF family protein [Firmicutes bacterium]|nr:CpaF family protein [Bacillota bacterium]